MRRRAWSAKDARARFWSSYRHHKGQYFPFTLLEKHLARAYVAGLKAGHAATRDARDPVEAVAICLVEEPARVLPAPTPKPAGGTEAAK